MKYVYIDESGDLGLGARSSKYLVIASISTDNPRALEKAVKRVWLAKKKYHYLNELHCSEVDDSTRKKMLFTLKSLDIKISTTVHRKSISDSDASRLYYGLLSNHILNLGLAHKIIVVDKKDTNQKRKELLVKFGLNDIFENVVFRDSKEVRQLQAVDFVAWAKYNKLENKTSEFWEIIRGRS